MEAFKLFATGGGGHRIVPRLFALALASFIVWSAAAPAQSSPSSRAPPASRFNVITHHYDNLRTGWNQNEWVLNTSDVNPQSFGLLYTVPVDDQVDAQPLVVGLPESDGRTQLIRDVAYVVTENNTVYAIDAETGVVLNSRHLGTPVPQAALPGRCGNNGPNVGITSTPVIDLDKRRIYLVAYTMENGQPVYRLHALDLRTLQDTVGSGVVVTAAQTLTDGTVYLFNAAVTRQRPALLEANGNIYAAFGSFCDLMTNITRGWVLGWDSRGLDPLPANQLNDRLSTSPSGMFLSSIWMSGAGIAADGNGHLFFVTANSDAATYVPPENIQESVVEMSGDLRRILGLYTPGNQQTLDQDDWDFGSGGVLIVPPQKSLPLPHLAVAAGKAGYLTLMNRDAFAGLSNPGKVVQSFIVGACFCAE